MLWTPAQDTQLKLLYESGLPFRQIAPHFGVSFMACHKRVQRLKLGNRFIERKWTDEMDSRLRELKAEGLSATLIGREMGKSRNAIIGRMHRLGLCGASTKRAYGPRRPKQHRINIARIFRPIVPKPESLGFSIIDLPPHCCKFAEGDSPYTFCGQPTLEGLSWCPYHCSVVFQGAC